MFDTKKFIFEVQERPALYNLQSTDYSNRDLKAKLWLEIGKQMVDNWDELENRERNEVVRDLMKKWKNIKDSYFKKVKTENFIASDEPSEKKKKYIYHDLLSFLRPVVEHAIGRRSSNIIQPPVTENDVVVIVEEEEDKDINNHYYCNHNNNNNNLSLEKSSSPQHSYTNNSLLQLAMNEIQKQDVKGNLAFMMSFVPIMDEMTPEQVVEIRYQIANLFRNQILVKEKKKN